MRSAEFKVNPDRCTGCGLCLKVCPGNMTGGNVLTMHNGIVVMKDQNAFGWRGCWRCQHCIAVCPHGAISIFGLNADTMPARPDESIAEQMTRLVQYRRTCRAFKKEDVDPKVIDSIIQAVSAVPAGGNSFALSFSVVDSRRAMNRLYEVLFPYQQMGLFENENTIGKIGIYNAPHLFIAHKPVGRRFHDGDLTELGIATAYFELLANAYGLGTVITNHGAEVIMKNREARQLLGIPDDHSALACVGFGYPSVQYARGVIKQKKVYRLHE